MKGRAVRSTEINASGKGSRSEVRTEDGWLESHTKDKLWQIHEHPSVFVPTVSVSWSQGWLPITSVPKIRGGILNPFTALCQATGETMEVTLFLTVKKNRTDTNASLRDDN